MIPTPKFTIGQRVFCARVGYGSVKIQCPDCLGKRVWYVRTPAGEEWEHDCNTCRSGWYSTGQIDKWSDHEHIQELTIGSVQIDTASKEEPVRYMCEETGIGSGSVYDERQMFTTREEAKAWCAVELQRVAALRREEEANRLASKKRDSIYKRQGGANEKKGKAKTARAQEGA